MKKVKRWRYFCEHCNKSGGSGFHMAKHERGCTLNPDRVCGLCPHIEADQKPMADLVAILDGHFLLNDEGFTEAGEGLGDAMKILRIETEGCPACMLAAIRQTKVDGAVPVSDFSVGNEFKKFWHAVNESNYEEPSMY